MYKGKTWKIDNSKAKASEDIKAEQTPEQDPGDGLGLEGLFSGIIDYQVGKYEPKNNTSIVYVLQKDGVYEVRQNRLGVLSRKLLTHNFPALPIVVQEGIKLNIPKVPYYVWQDLLAFYQHFHNLHQTEVMVMVFYDPGADKWIYYTPPQIVASTACDWDEGEGDTLRELTDKYIPVLCSHSHHNMTGHFSSTDDKHDQLPDMMYLVIGDIFKSTPSYQIRFSVGQHKVLLNFADIFQVPADYKLDLSKFPDWEKNCKRKVYAVQNMGLFDSVKDYNSLKTTYKPQAEVKKESYLDRDNYYNQASRDYEFSEGCEWLGSY